MITLQPITETNFLTAAALSVSPDQGRYVAPAPIILAGPMPTAAIGQAPGAFMTAAAWWAWR